MKRVFGLFFLLGLFAFTACNDDSSILEPTFQASEGDLEKGRVILPLGGRGFDDGGEGLDGFNANDGGDKNDLL